MYLITQRYIENKSQTQLSFCLCHRLSLSLCGFLRLSTKCSLFTCYFRFLQFLPNLKCLKTIQKKRFCRPTDLFFSAREPETQLFFCGLNVLVFLSLLIMILSCFPSFCVFLSFSVVIYVCIRDAIPYKAKCQMLYIMGYYGCKPIGLPPRPSSDRPPDRLITCLFGRENIGILSEQ